MECVWHACFSRHWNKKLSFFTFSHETSCFTKNLLQKLLLCTSKVLESKNISDRRGSIFSKFKRVRKSQTNSKGISWNKHVFFTSMKRNYSFFCVLLNPRWFFCQIQLLDLDLKFLWWHKHSTFWTEGKMNTILCFLSSLMISSSFSLKFGSLVNVTDYDFFLHSALANIIWLNKTLLESDPYSDNRSCTVITAQVNETIRDNGKGKWTRF